MASKKKVSDHWDRARGKDIEPEILTLDWSLEELPGPLPIISSFMASASQEHH